MTYKCVCAQVEMNPLEVAVSELGAKNTELRWRIAAAAALEGRSAPQSFSSVMSGVVDAAVNGGVSNYKAFLTGDYELTHPEIEEDVRASIDTKVSGFGLGRVFEAEVWHS